MMPPNAMSCLVSNTAQRSQQPSGEFASADPTTERIMKRFKSARQRPRFVSIHDPIANLFHFPRHTRHLPTIGTCAPPPYKSGAKLQLSPQRNSCTGQRSMLTAHDPIHRDSPSVSCVGSSCRCRISLAIFDGPTKHARPNRHSFARQRVTRGYRLQKTAPAPASAR